MRGPDITVVLISKPMAHWSVRPSNTTKSQPHIYLISRGSHQLTAAVTMNDEHLNYVIDIILKTAANNGYAQGIDDNDVKQVWKAKVERKQGVIE